MEAISKWRELHDTPYLVPRAYTKSKQVQSNNQQEDQMISFQEGIKTIVNPHISEIGQMYLPWATAIALARRPKINTLMFDGSPVLPMFGGGVVGVECGGTEVFLPIMDNKNRPIPLNKMDSRAVNDSINRCRAKAIACATGVGMCLYAGVPDAIQYLKSLKVTPESKLDAIQPMLSVIPPKKPQPGKQPRPPVPYLKWAHALTAAKIVHPELKWRPVRFGDEGQLYAPVYGQGFLVGVEITIGDQSHAEILPIMDYMMKSIANPNAFAWSKAIMRALAKGIAVMTGYGLSVYAKEEVSALQPIVPQKTVKPVVVDDEIIDTETGEITAPEDVEAPAPKVETPTESQEPQVEDQAHASAKAVKQIKKLLTAYGRTPEEVAAFLNLSSNNIDEWSEEEAQAALKLLGDTES